VLSSIAADHPRITEAWVDNGYRTKVIDHGARLGIDVEVTRRDPAQKGFKVIPRRWVVERTFGCLMHHRRPARDYKALPPPLRSHGPPRHDRPHETVGSLANRPRTGATRDHGVKHCHELAGLAAIR